MIVLVLVPIELVGGVCNVSGPRFQKQDEKCESCQESALCQVQCFRCQVLCFRCKVLSFMHQTLCGTFQVPGVRCQESGARRQMPGAKCSLYETNSRRQVSNRYCQESGARNWVPRVGGVLKRVNLVNFLLQADSISFKGIYPGYKKTNWKKFVWPLICAT